MRKALSISFFLVSTGFASSAFAGVIADENKYTGDQSAWTISNDGTAAKDGVVDVYPSKWSIKTGESIALKIRSTTNYTAKVFRLGWYGGGGAKPVAEKTGGANPQPYPSTATDDYTKYGLLHGGWSDTLTFDTTGWVPGMYWVRVDQAGGKQAATYFVVRENGAKMPILVLMPFATEEAYNAWPGKDRGGKSIYAWNSSPSWPTETIGMAQAVKVSFDRPFLVGAGTGDFTNYQYPGLRWMERQGYDVGYATDMDVDADPSLLLGRKAIVLVGHSEYWTRKAYDAAIAARDSGVSLLSMSGDTINWQIRYEDAYKTMVGFKESADNSCPRDIDGCTVKNPDGTCSMPLGECKAEYFKSQTKDPEAVAGHDALLAGNVEEAKRHFALVTSHWNTLYYSTKDGIDVRRPGLFLTGVQTAGIIMRPDGWGYPWTDYVFSGSRSWWLFEGVTCDRIPGVGGYEIDSAATADRYYDKWRPVTGVGGVEVGQKRFAALVQSWDGKNRGSTSYYRMSNGAEVVSMSSMAFTWALDDFAAKVNGVTTSVSSCAQRMIQNVLDRWTGATPAPAPTFPDAGPEEDAGPGEVVTDTGVPIEPGDGDVVPPGDAGVVGDGSVGPTPQADPIEDPASTCGCRVPGASAAGTAAIGSMSVFAALALLRLRRRK